MKSGDSFSPLIRSSSSIERRVFVALTFVYAGLTLSIVPWATLPGAQVPQIIAFCNGGVALADVCTALVLGREFHRTGRDALLLLACAYLFSALMAVLQAAAFPGAIFSSPLFGGSQTAAWLFVSWRLGTASLLLAAVASAHQPALGAAPRELKRRLYFGVLLTVLACAVLTVASALVEVPAMTSTRFTNYNLAAVAIYGVTCGVALLLIWRKRAFEDALYLWLALVLVASISDQVLASFGGGQYTVGWHAGKVSTVITACMLLVFWLGHAAGGYRKDAMQSVASYGGAIAVMIGALLLRWFVTPWIGDAVPFSTVFGAVAIGVWIGGWRPATVSAGLGFVAATKLFVDPGGAFGFHTLADLLGAGMYWVSCALIIGLGEAMRRARDRYHVAEDRFRRSQEASIQGYAMLTPIRDEAGVVRDFRWDYINPLGASMARRSPEALIGHNLTETLPATIASGVFGAFVAVAESGSPSDLEVRYDGKDVTRWFRHLVVKVGEGVSVSFFDISETKRLEAELRKRAADLQRADTNKSQFLALLSHELRNPLAPLLNGLALLAKQREPLAIAETQAMMVRQINHLRRLIDDLLDVSRIDRGKLELRRERVAVNTVVRTAIETARPNIDAKSHELIVRLSPEPLHVEGDAIRLSQIVSNLLNNAAKFTPPGGRIEIAIDSSQGHAVVEVSDTGIGFDAGDEQRMFDMFVQLDASRATAAGGLGLGLTLVRWLAEMHGGTIEASSAGAGHGAQFVLRLPLAVAPSATVPSIPGRSAAAARRRVLVVDDNADAADSLAQMLTLEGYEARACHDGQSAFEAACDFKPDVAFIDLNMPGMSGIELAAKLRARARSDELRLVALTGMGQKSDIEATTAAGFYAHLTKPASAEEVMQLAAAEAGNVVPIDIAGARRVDRGAKRS